MNPNRWRLVSEIYSAVMDCPPSERDAYVSQLCGDDPALESEVRRLIEADLTTDGFLEHPFTLMDDLLPKNPVSHPRFQPGDRLCDRFEIVRFLARGGMGEVYEAFDSLLREPAALKTIRSEIASNPQVIEQFKQEVSRARAIRSDYVCQIFELFEHSADGTRAVFLTMRLLHGETIAERLERRGPFTPEEALPLLKQIAAGLDAAHFHRDQIIHGDLKSGNVMLVRTVEGELATSITDFGLVRRGAMPAAGAEAPAEVVRAVGTPGWLSPEREAGEPPSKASDIYALGLLAFHMVTGVLPSGPESLSALNGNWRRAIGRCLRSDPADRCGSGAEFSMLLEGGGAPVSVKRSWLWTAFALVAAVTASAAWFITSSVPLLDSAIPEKSLAVLPLVSPVSGVEADYLADALTEELSHSAAGIKGLRVVGPETAFRFKGSSVDPHTIASQLRVRYLLTGSVRRTEGRVRVLVRLTRLPEGFQVWAHEYNRDGTGVSGVKEDIVRNVAGTMGLSVAGFGTGPGRPADTRAQDLYWMGRYHWRARTETGLQRSVEYFEKAVAIDPEFALGWAGVADGYAAIAERSIIPPAEALARAHRASMTALSLDRELADAWVSRGQVVSLYERNLEEAERCFKRALELNPRLTTAHQWYSYLLVKQRRFPEALKEARESLDADPMSLPANINLAVQLYYSRDDDGAIEQCRRIMELEPGHFLNRLVVAQILARRGRVAQALQEMEKIAPAQQEHALTLRFWAELYAIVGRRAEAEKVLEKITAKRRQGGVPASYIAAGWAALGQSDEAFEWLDTAYREYDGYVSMVHAAPAFDSLRSDARYPAVLARLGIKGGTPPDSVHLN